MQSLPLQVNSTHIKFKSYSLETWNTVIAPGDDFSDHTEAEKTV